MSWQQFSNNRAGWRRYLPEPDGSRWEVCPTCAQAIEAHDVQEQARDRRALWGLRISYLAIIALVVLPCGACWLLSRLAAH